MTEQLRKVTDICPICEDVKELEYGTKKETLTINKQKIHVSTKAYYCKDGNHYFYDPVDEEKKFQDAYREYRRLNGLLQPEEIKEIREKYGLSQKAFARFMGWGEITIQRYEAGALQDYAHNNFLLLIKETSTFEKLFEIRKPHLEMKDVIKISSRLEEMKRNVLSTVSKERSKQEVLHRRLKHIQRLQFAGNYIYHKPYVSEEGELALAS